MITRRQFGVTAGAAAASVYSAHVLAQTLETARIIVGFAPGGTTDTIARRLAESIRERYARTVTVENRPGAGGQIAVNTVKNANPDGQTILITPMSMMVVYPHIYRTLQYDPVADFAPVSMAATFDHAFAVGPAVHPSVQTVPEFLIWAKSNPSQQNFGSPAAGSVPHFLGELLGRSASMNLKHVPFPGTQPAVLSMLGGHIPAVSGPVGEFLQQTAAGRIRIIGTSGARRNRFAPNVPTYAEQGIQGVTTSEWFAAYMPVRTPADVVQRANAAIQAALGTQPVVDGFAAMGLEVSPTTGAVLAQRQKADTDRWAPIIRQIGFTADS